MNEWKKRKKIIILAWEMNTQSRGWHDIELTTLSIELRWLVVKIMKFNHTKNKSFYRLTRIRLVCQSLNRMRLCWRWPNRIRLGWQLLNRIRLVWQSPKGPFKKYVTIFWLFSDPPSPPPPPRVTFYYFWTLIFRFILPWTVKCIIQKVSLGA